MAARRTRPSSDLPSEKDDMAALSEFGLVPRDIGHHRTILKVETSRGTFAVKRSRLTPEEIQFVHAAQEHLARRGFDNASRFLVSSKGRPYLVVGSRIYVVTPWVESRVADYGNTSDLRLAATTLARMHQASQGFPLAGQAGLSRVEWGRWPTRFAERLSDLVRFKRDVTSRRSRDRFDRVFLDNVDYYVRQGELALELLSNSRYQSLVESERALGGFCHHDYSHRNVLVTPSGGVYLVDFDYCICDLRAHDVASLILRNMKTTGWNPERAFEILSYYETASPLTAADYEAILILLVWPQDFWRVAMQYYDERRPWTKGRFQSSIRRRTAYKPEREAFFRRFASTMGLAYPAGARG